jgi:hypothetical protein
MFELYRLTGDMSILGVNTLREDRRGAIWFLRSDRTDDARRSGHVGTGAGAFIRILVEG